MELLADLLEGWPTVTAGQRYGESDPRQLGLASQVGDAVHINLEAP